MTLLSRGPPAKVSSFYNQLHQKLIMQTVSALPTLISISCSIIEVLVQHRRTLFCQVWYLLCEVLVDRLDAIADFLVHGTSNIAVTHTSCAVISPHAYLKYLGKNYFVPNDSICMAEIVYCQCIVCISSATFTVASRKMIVDIPYSYNAVQDFLSIDLSKQKKGKNGPVTQSEVYPL